MVYGKIGESTQYMQSEPSEGMVEMKSERPLVGWVANEDGEWVLPPTNPEDEYEWSQNELIKVSKEISYHNTSSSFATCTLVEWIKYQEALLHYVTLEDDEYSLNDITPLYNYVDEDTGRPLSPPQDTELNYLLDKAKKLRDDTISSDLLSQGMLFQVRDTVDLNNIQDAIDEAEYSSLPAEYTLDFRLADNTWATVTVDTLKQVKSDYRTRKLSTYTAFKTWTEGNMSEAFTL